MIQLNEIKSGMTVRSTLTGETYLVTPNAIGNVSSLIFNSLFGYVALHCSRKDQCYNENLVDYIPIAFLEVIDES